jgi:hypothetical protein
LAVKLWNFAVELPEAKMKTDSIKDAKGTVLGSIESNDDGSQVLRDAAGKIRGYYDPTTDHTRGPDKRILAKGNVLRTLIC